MWMQISGIYAIVNLFVVILLVLGMSWVGLWPERLRLKHLGLAFFFPAVIISYLFMFIVALPLVWFISLEIWNKPLFKRK